MPIDAKKNAQLFSRQQSDYARIVRHLYPRLCEEYQKFLSLQHEIEDRGLKIERRFLGLAAKEAAITYWKAKEHFASAANSSHNVTYTSELAGTSLDKGSIELLASSFDPVYPNKDIKLIFENRSMYSYVDVMLNVTLVGYISYDVSADIQERANVHFNVSFPGTFYAGVQKMVTIPYSVLQEYPGIYRQITYEAVALDNGEETIFGPLSVPESVLDLSMIFEIKGEDESGE